MSKLLLVAFFAISMAYQTGWTAVSSMLGAYKMLFGPAIFLRIHLAFFLPSIPVLLFQAQFDHKLNRRLGIGTATSVRMISGLGGSAVVCALLPFYTWNERALTINVVLLGITSAVAFSGSYQLVSHFPASCNVALTAGFVGGGPLILLLELAARIGPQASFWKSALLFEFAAVITIAGLAAAQLLVLHHWEHLQAGSSQDASEPLLPSWLRGPMQQTATFLGASKGSTPPPSPDMSVALTPQTSLASTVSASEEDLHSDDSEILTRPSSASKGSAMGVTCRAMWPAAACLFLSIGASMVVAPFFTYVPSSGWLGDLLPQALFAARTLADVGGRFLPIVPFMRTRSGLLIASVLRALLVPFFFWYTVAAPRALLNDVVATAAIALFWAGSGYFNACSYVMAATWAPAGAKERAGGIMALVFQVSCLLALLLATGLQRILFKVSI